MPTPLCHEGLLTSRQLVLILSTICATGCANSADEGNRDGGVQAATGGASTLRSASNPGTIATATSGATHQGGASGSAVIATGGLGMPTSGAYASGASTAGGATPNTKAPLGGAVTSEVGVTMGGNTVGNGAAGGSIGSNVTTHGSVARGGKGATGETHPTSAVHAGGTGATSSVVSGGGSTQTTGSGESSSEILVPESGALLGLYYGDASIAATATKLGTTVPLHLTYYAWEDDWTRGNTADDLRSGRIPFVNWELFGAVLDDIIAGKDDAMIQQRAVAAKNLNAKLFVDFGAEMNGDWSPWSGAENGKSADKYVAAYRHVHDVFVEQGATNVIWAFCPNVTSEPDASWNEPLDYYPGDTYVDWMCVDGYNWGTSDSWGAWQSFHDVFVEIYPTLASKQKPILIGEMASTELGGNKGEWIAQIIPTLKTDFPLIKGLIWFDIDKETDWRISSSAASEAAFKALANDPYFKR